MEKKNSTNGEKKQMSSAAKAAGYIFIAGMITEGFIGPLLPPPIGFAGLKNASFTQPAAATAPAQQGKAPAPKP